VIPIGRPIGNTEVYVLDAGMKRVPVGVPGELHIGGAGVARGYRGRPELTAERFIPDVFSGRPEARLYRTGDLVRFRADGQLEYLGRLDDQVKVRGFRIELGEVEATLAAHPGIAQAVAGVADGSQGDGRLVAWYVQQPNAACTSTELRRYLKERLPDYMVPSLVVEIARVPLTPNGKVNRRELPNPF